MSQEAFALSQNIDALVLIGHSHMVSSEVPAFHSEDIDHGLWLIQNGATEWADHKPITEYDKINLSAGDVFLDLGRLATDYYAQQLPEQAQAANPLRAAALDVLDEISPFKTGETLRADFIAEWPSMQLMKRGLPELFEPALDAEPSIEDELTEKWRRAQSVYESRGNIPTRAYDAEALLTGIGGLNIDEIAPDEVQFDDDLNPTIASYYLLELAKRAGVAPQLVGMHEYRTFKPMRNGAKMLESALLDLKLVRQAIAQ